MDHRQGGGYGVRGVVRGPGGRQVERRPPNDPPNDPRNPNPNNTNRHNRNTNNNRRQCNTNLLEMSLDSNCYFRMFIVFSFIKFVAAAIILLVVAIKAQTEIEGYANQANCAQCLYQAQLPANANTLYEFGACAELFYPALEGVAADNLLTKKGLLDFSGQSQVASLTALAVFVLVGVVILASLYVLLAFQLGHPDTVTTMLLMYFNFLVVVVLLQLCNSVWLLKFTDGCYTGVVSPAFVYALMVLLVTFILLTVVTGYGSDQCTVSVIILTVAVLFAYSVMSVVIGAENTMQTGDLMPFALVFVVFVSTFEIPTFLFSLKFLSEFFGTDEEDPLEYDEIDA